MVSAEVARLKEILSTHPADALAHYQLGLAYRELGDNRQATLDLQAAIAAGFDNLGARLNLMEAAFACGQSALALVTAERVVSPALTSVDVLLRVGRLLFDHLFYKTALRAFEQAERLAPDAFEPRFRLALTYYLLDDYAAAIAQLKPATGVQLTPEAASLIASAQAKSGDVESAITVLRESIERYPQSPHAYVNLALIELDRGSTSEAEAMLERFRALKVQANVKVFYTASRNSCPQIANALEQGNAPAHSSHVDSHFYYQLAVQFQDRLNYLSAAEFIRLAQISEGNSVRVLLAAGTSCVGQDPLAPESVEILRAAIDGDPNLHQAFYLLGLAYARQGKIEEAVKAHQRAIALHPTASYYVSLGKELRDRQSAIAAFEGALALDKSYAQAHLELGRLYVQMEEFDKARPELEKAVDLQPDFYEADYLLGRLYHRLGEEERSRRVLKEFEEKKNALLQRSTIGASPIGDGR